MILQCLISLLLVLSASAHWLGGLLLYMFLNGAVPLFFLAICLVSSSIALLVVAWISKTWSGGTAGRLWIVGGILAPLLLFVLLLVDGNVSDLDGGEWPFAGCPLHNDWNQRMFSRPPSWLLEKIVKQRKRTRAAFKQPRFSLRFASRRPAPRGNLGSAVVYAERVMRNKVLGLNKPAKRLRRGSGGASPIMHLMFTLVSGLVLTSATAWCAGSVNALASIAVCAPLLPTLAADFWSSRYNGVGYGTCALHTATTILATSLSASASLFDPRLPLDARMAKVAATCRDDSLLDPTVARDPRKVLNDALYQYGVKDKCVARWGDLSAEPGACAAIKFVRVNGAGHCYAATRKADGDWVTIDNGCYRYGISTQDLIGDDPSTVAFVNSPRTKLRDLSSRRDRLSNSSTSNDQNPVNFVSVSTYLVAAVMVRGADILLCGDVAANPGPTLGFIAGLSVALMLLAGIHIDVMERHWRTDLASRSSAAASTSSAPATPPTSTSSPATAPSSAPAPLPSTTAVVATPSPSLSAPPPFSIKYETPDRIRTVEAELHSVAVQKCAWCFLFASHSPVPTWIALCIAAAASRNIMKRAGDIELNPGPVSHIAIGIGFFAAAALSHYLWTHSDWSAGAMFTAIGKTTAEYGGPAAVTVWNVSTMVGGGALIPHAALWSYVSTWSIESPPIQLLIQDPRYITTDQHGNKLAIPAWNETEKLFMNIQCAPMSEYFVNMINNSNFTENQETTKDYCYFEDEAYNQTNSTSFGWWNRYQRCRQFYPKDNFWWGASNWYIFIRCVEMQLVSSGTLGSRTIAWIKLFLFLVFYILYIHLSGMVAVVKWLMAKLVASIGRTWDWAAAEVYARSLESALANSPKGGQTNEERITFLMLLERNSLPYNVFVGVTGFGAELLELTFGGVGRLIVRSCRSLPEGVGWTICQALGVLELAAKYVVALPITFLFEWAKERWNRDDDAKLCGVCESDVDVIHRSLEAQFKACEDANLKDWAGTKVALRDGVVSLKNRKDVFAAPGLHGFTILGSIDKFGVKTSSSTMIQCFDKLDEGPAGTAPNLVVDLSQAPRVVRFAVQRAIATVPQKRVIDAESGKEKLVDDDARAFYLMSSIHELGGEKFGLLCRYGRSGFGHRFTNFPAPPEVLRKQDGSIPIKRSEKLKAAAEKTKEAVVAATKQAASIARSASSSAVAAARSASEMARQAGAKAMSAAAKLRDASPDTVQAWARRLGVEGVEQKRVAPFEKLSEEETAALFRSVELKDKSAEMAVQYAKGRLAAMVPPRQVPQENAEDDNKKVDAKKTDNKEATTPDATAQKVTDNKTRTAPLKRGGKRGGSPDGRKQDTADGFTKNPGDEAPQADDANGEQATKASRVVQGPGYGICAIRSVTVVLEAVAPTVVDIAAQLGVEVHPHVSIYADERETLSNKMKEVADVCDDFGLLDPTVPRDPHVIIGDALYNSGGIQYPGEDRYHKLGTTVRVTECGEAVPENAIAVAAIKYTRSANGAGHCFAALRTPDGKWVTDDNGHRTRGVTTSTLVGSSPDDIFWIYINYPEGTSSMERDLVIEEALPAEVRANEDWVESYLGACLGIRKTAQILLRCLEKPSDAVRWLAAPTTTALECIRCLSVTLEENKLLQCDRQCEAGCDNKCKYNPFTLYNRLLNAIDADSECNGLKHYVYRGLKPPANRRPQLAFAYFKDDNTIHVLQRLRGCHYWASIAETPEVAVMNDEELRLLASGVVYAWVDEVPRQTNSEVPCPPCSACNKPLDDHPHRKIVRHCSECDAVNYGPCCASTAICSASYNENMLATDAALTCYLCDGCVAEGRKVVEREEATRVTREAGKRSSEASKSSSGTSTPRSPAKDNSAEKKPEDADASKRAGDPALSTATPASPTTSTPAPSSAPPAGELPSTCAGCKQRVKGDAENPGHAFGCTHRTCSRCSGVYFGKCHGEEYRKAGIKWNGKKNYVCASCRGDKATDDAAKLKAAAEALAPQKTAEPKPAAADTGAAKRPSESCAGCKAPSHTHAYSKNHRTCCKCKKTRYGACHGENHLKEGRRDNNKADYVCNDCLTPEQRAKLVRFVPPSDAATFASHPCACCSVVKAQHQKSSSWRKCSDCGCFAFGSCHGGDLRVGHNGDAYKCPVCSGEPNSPVNIARREHEAAKDTTESTVVPEGYDEDTNPTLGAIPSAATASIVKPSANVTLPCLTDSPPNSEKGFRFSLSNSPAAALVTGEMFLALDLSKPEPNTILGHSPATSDAHFKYLTMLRIHLLHSPEWRSVPLTHSITRLLLILAKHRKWAPQSLTRVAQSFHGAMTNLSLYSTAKVGVSMGQDAYWVQMMKFWRLRSNQNQPHDQAALVGEQALHAMNAAPVTQLETKAAIALMWSTAARFTDIANLRRSHVVWDRKTRHLQLRVQEGKVMAKVQPYTVTTTVCEEMAQVVEDHLSLFPEPNQHLFPFSAIDRATRLRNINEALHQVGKEFTTRALRRGSLQSMAMAGVPLKTIMLYSGHRSEDTCLRYLDWGKQAAHRNEAAKLAAVHLRPLPAGSH
jgi:integrase